MSRPGAETVQREAREHAHGLQKPPDESAIQQLIASGNLVNTASVVMTGRFSTAC
jgi:hypothetical protein